MPSSTCLCVWRLIFLVRCRLSTHGCAVAFQREVHLSDRMIHGSNISLACVSRSKYRIGPWGWIGLILVTSGKGSYRDQSE